MPDLTAPVPLRNLTAKVVTGADAAALETALNAFLVTAGDDAMVFSVTRVADYTVLVLYTE